jgi:signal transduction histidine kinase
VKFSENPGLSNNIALILPRLSLVTKKVIEISQSGNLSLRINLPGEDEVSVLSKEIDTMLGAIEQRREDCEKKKKDFETKAEEEKCKLEEEQIKLNASIDCLNVGFIMVNSASEVILINSVAKRILYPAGEDLQDYRLGVVSDKNVKALNDCSIDSIANQLSSSFKIKEEIQKTLSQAKPLVFKNVSLRNHYFHVYLNPIVLDGGEVRVVGCVVIIEDTTEEMLLQRSKDEFFSVASHELRTPLTAIKGNTCMLLDYFGEQFKDPQINEMISDIRESSIRLIKIVNDFLDVSRLELGKIQFKKEILDLPQLIPDVIKQYKFTDSAKKLYVNFDDKEKVPSVIGDKDRFMQVLINLIGNGLKFTEKGGITISLKTEGDFVKALVSDTGMGIDLKSQNILFQKFQQAQNNIYTRDASKSTGLGLYVSRMMVEGMGGEIKLEKSVIGGGTTFSFTLPVAK